MHDYLGRQRPRGRLLQPKLSAAAVCVRVHVCLQRAVKVTRDTVYRMRHAQDTTLRNPVERRDDDAGEELLSTCKRFGRCPCVLSVFPACKMSLDLNAVGRTTTAQ